MPAASAPGLLTVGANTTISGTAVNAPNPIRWGSTTVNLGNYGSAGLTLSGGQDWGVGVTRTFNVTAVSGSTFSAQALGGAIVGSGTLIKQGIGTLALTGPSMGSADFTGAQAFQIKNGTLQLTNAVGDAALGMVPVAPVADNIVIDGGVLSATGGTVTLNVNRGITLGGVANVGTIDASNVFTIPAVITGGGLIKTGTNRLDLAAINTYTGETYITAGSLRVLNNQALSTTGAGTIVFGGASLETSDANGPLILAAEPITLNGTGVSAGGALRNVAGISGIAVVTGPITLDTSARINSDSATLILTNTISGNNNATLTLGGAGYVQLNGAIDATVGALFKDGAGSTLLHGRQWAQRSDHDLGGFAAGAQQRRARHRGQQHHGDGRRRSGSRWCGWADRHRRGSVDAQWHGRGRRRCVAQPHRQQQLCGSDRARLRGEHQLRLRHADAHRRPHRHQLRPYHRRTGQDGDQHDRPQLHERRPDQGG